MRSHLSFANVVSCIALFVALGGTSYAVTKIPRNSVGSSEVRNRSLKAVDLAKGVVKQSVRGPRGAQGPQGPLGVGVAGPAGERGPSDVVTANRNLIFFALGPSSIDALTINLPAGAWSLIGSASIVADSTADFYRCYFTFDGVRGESSSVSRIGGDSSGAVAAVVVVQQSRTLAGPTAVRLRCSHDVSLPGGNPRIDHAQVTALRTANLEVQPG